MTEQLPEKYKASIVSFRNDRMGARFLSLLNTIRIAGDYDLPYFFTWMTHGRASEELQAPTEIFDQAYFDAHFVSHDDFRHVDAVATDLAALPLTATADLMDQTKTKGGVLMCMGTELVVLPWETADDVAPRYAAAIDQLVFSAAIQEAMRVVDATLAQASTAFHIRRGDIIHDTVTSNQLWSNKYIPREFYEVLGKQLTADPEHKILVFSDEPAEITRLQAMSPQIMVPDEILPKGLTLAQRDFMEIYAMSRCSQIIGPPGSGFSMAAALIGHCPIVDITTRLDEFGQAEALDLLVQRLTDRSPLFLTDGDIGQSLPFACDYLNRTGRATQALDLLSGYHKDGFSKLFFYKMLLEQQQHCGQFTAYPQVLKSFETANLDRALPARVEQHLSEIARVAAVLAANAGHREDLHHHAAMAFWYGGGNRTAYNTFAAFIAEDLIDPTRFALPYDPDLMRRLPATLGPRPGTEGVPHTGDAPVQMAMPPDLLVRDWHVFMGKTLNRGFNTDAGAARALEMMTAQFGRVVPPAALNAAQGVYASALGKHDTALELHRKALHDHSDQPLYVKRMATTMLAIDPQDRVARLLLERAAALAPDQSLYQAELAQCLFQQGAKPAAIAMMTSLTQSPDCLPEIPFLAARMIRQVDRKDDSSLPLITKALAMAPHLRRYMMLRVNILIELGQLQDAQNAMDDVITRYGEGGDIKALRARPPLKDM